MPTLTELRLKAGLTRSQVACQGGFSPWSVIRWETGKNIPLFDRMQKLSEILGVSLQEVQSVFPRRAIS